ncbi:hypothetical protein [Roseomonas harenae]|uniref:hypothetical protein n=1 Tax=Muricoccus harenae TaxID=2692566 RepID=UPI0013312B11|nr:hypothetical protein [Roseomonas harenae]
MQLAGGSLLYCPRCHSPGFHHGRITAYQRIEDAKQVTEITIDRDCSTLRLTDGQYNPSRRRQDLAIQITCDECPSGLPPFELTIDQHKSATSIMWRESPNPNAAKASPPLSIKQRG